MAPSDRKSAPEGERRTTVTVLYFAALRDLVGTPEERVELGAEGKFVRELLNELEARHAGLRGRLSSVRVAVNEEFAETSASLHADDVVALIPPVSGG